jgi:hypothetical protein
LEVLFSQGKTNDKFRAAGVIITATALYMDFTVMKRHQVFAEGKTNTGAFSIRPLTARSPVKTIKNVR